MPERVERARKPAKCPSCGAAPVASILYGLPAFDDNLEQAIDCQLKIFRAKKDNSGVG